MSDHNLFGLMLNVPVNSYGHVGVYIILIWYMCMFIIYMFMFTNKWVTCFVNYSNLTLHQQYLPQKFVFFAR